MLINDAHCHFFSSKFFDTLTAGMRAASGAAATGLDAVATLGWDPPGSPEALADRWITELDAHQVARAALIASVPGDEDSVAVAVARHPSRFVGYFMVDPRRDDAVMRTVQTLERPGMRTVCLFPAMQGFSLHDDCAMRVMQAASVNPGAAVFVHCGVLSVGVRKKLGLPSNFDIRFGNPLDLHAAALAFPKTPFIIPHFGAGMLREALMVADLCPNIYLDTSSSNRWMRYLPGVALKDVFAQALAVVGSERLLFGSDSSFFPRGWVRAVYEDQSIVIPEQAAVNIFHGNFEHLFPPT